METCAMWFHRGYHCRSWSKCMSFLRFVCEMIKQNESEFANTEFKMQPNKPDNFFYLVFILQPFNCTHFKNHLTNFSEVCCKWCVQSIWKCLTSCSFYLIASHVLPNIFVFLNYVKLFVFNVGTPALTSRALGEDDFIQVAEFIHQGVQIAAQAKKEAGRWQKWHQMLLVLWSSISSTNRHSDVSGKKNKSLYITMSICRRYNEWY